MSDEKRLNLLEKVAIVMFAALIAYFVLTFGLSLPQGWIILGPIQ
ncbi:Uncharacterised protein [Serratia rubidaea]|uniref:Uncharacterized protein n=1 Tax=Serratia rubidaea TaxID=61652 RepID=A0A4U9HHB5_SERRU|nr:Uncharacterised protein [Serratia rubidaea]